MTPIADFLQALDEAWTREDAGQVELRVLRSGALFLQTDYVRGTKDGDVLRTTAMSDEVLAALESVAGKGTALHTRHQMYLDVVSANVPMLPVEPLWHHYPLGLDHFEILVLDIHDVVVSKLKRWNPGDRDDVRAMVERDHVERARLVGRLRSVVERYKFDARADRLPEMARRFNEVERDWFALSETPFDFPEEWFR